MRDSDTFFDPSCCSPFSPSADAYELRDGRLTFTSALVTPHSENNTVHARFFPATEARIDGTRRAVLVLHQWNGDGESHVGLCRLFARCGISALRLTLPYHDRRMPPELHRADFIVSANIVRTLQVCRQAVLDARKALRWLAREGYERIAIMGTSLGSCLSMLTAAHEPLVDVVALNFISPYFADVVWEGLTTAHIREAMEGHIGLDVLRRCWMPISPYAYVDRLRGKQVLLVYAKYDLSFPVRLSRVLVEEFRRLKVEHALAVLPSGHYTTARPPFSWWDAYKLVTFLRTHL